MALKDRITIQNHPELNSALLDYCGILNFLEGSIGTISTHLVRYQAEEDGTKEAINHYSMRLKRLYHKPIMEPSHQIHMAHLNQKIKWGTIGESKIKDFLLNVTGKGDTAEDMFEDMLWYRIGLGRVGVLVDGPKRTKPNETELDAKIEGLRSYQVLYRADQIKFWEFPIRGPLAGKLRKLVLCDEPEYTEDGKVLQRLRRFFYRSDSDNSYTWQILREAEQASGANKKKTSSGEWEVIEEGTGEIDQIPFVIWGDGLSDSLFRNVWGLEVANLNNNSSKTNIITKQGFQRIIVAGAADNELKKVGESIINKIKNENAKVYTIEAGNPDAAFKEEGLIESRAQRIALLQHNQLVDDTRQIQSAESKEKDMAAREKFYNKILDEAERKLKEIWALHYQFEGLAGGESIQISIVRDFGLKSSEVEMKERTSLSFMARSLGATDVAKEVLKTEISRTTFTVTEDETEAELKQRLYEAVDSVADPLAPDQTAAARPSIGNALRPPQNGTANKPTP